MANKKVSQLTSKPSVLVTDLFPIADPSTGQLYKTTISDLGTAIGSGVSSVNGLVGAVVLDTDDIQELVSPTNKWFTDTRARAALSASSPLAYNSGTGVFSIPAATSSQNGYLTSTDWTTFNNKLSTATAASTYVPYTGATANVNLGQNYSLTAALIIKSGGTSTQFLKADGTIDTNTYALDSAVVKLTGNQTIAGVKTFTSGIVADVTTGGTQGFASTNSSASGSSIFLQNNSTSVGNAIGINNTSTADGIAIGNETSGRGIYISNATTSGSGKGISIDNYNGGIGIEVGSDSTADAIKILHLSGRAFNIQSSGGGYGVIINNTTASTSAPFTIQKQGANKITFTDAGAGTFVSTISAAGATLTGALSGTTANFSSLVSIIGTSADFILVRANNSNTANILFGTDNTYSWSAGLRNIENENFYIYNQTNSTNSVTINNSTNAVTLAGALSGTSATFSGSVIVGTTALLNFGPTSSFVGMSGNNSTGALALYANNTQVLGFAATSGAATFSSSVTAGDLLSTSYGTARIQVTSTTNSANAGLRYSAKDSTGTTKNAGIYYVAGTSTSNTFLSLVANDNDYQLNVLANGNVGIGTTAPASPLSLSGASDVGMRIKAGSSSLCYIDFDDADSGAPNGSIAYNNGNNAMTFSTGGSNAERMRITSSGNVGIGTTNPVAKLALAISASATDVLGFDVTNSVDASFSVYLRNNITTLYAGGTGNMVFANSSERMRITSGGNVLVGTTSATPVSSNVIGINLSSGAQIQSSVDGRAVLLNRINDNGVTMEFHRGGTSVGNISVTTVSTTYNVTSDYRLKEDLQPINGLEIVNKIKVYDYKWKSEDSRMDGVLAHELAEVLPYAVTGVKDGEQMQSVDYSKIVPVMVQAIKELKAELDTLKNK